MLFVNTPTAAAGILPDKSSQSFRPIRLAYLTTEYPKVSHTFIRREILELERRGHDVLRLAIRGPGDNIADGKDHTEAARTIHFVSLPKVQILLATLKTVLARPLRFLSAFLTTIQMSRASERGLLRHLAYLLEAIAFLHITDQHCIQHVHVHFGTNAAAVARLIRLLGGPPYSMTIHGPSEFDAPIGFSLKDKITDAEFVVAISHFCFAQLCRWAPPEQWSKIHIVHCSVDEAYFSSDAPINGNSRMLLSIGRFNAQKGQFLLLEAVKKAVEEGIDLHLVLVGDGELRPLIERRINDYELSTHVQVTGWLDEASIRSLLTDARALVQPSFAEGLPVVIMEAFAMARPVISTHVAAIPELVRHQINGWLVSAGDVDELVAAIRDVMALPAEKLNGMGQKGRDDAFSRHHIESQATALESLLVAAATSDRTA